jgi:hypothetical protein
VEDVKTVCPNCECEVQSDDDFCPDCGTLLIEDVKCSVHQDENAEGVCVICREPFCNKCGAFVDDDFFCKNDSRVQFSEGRSNILESDNPQQIDIVKNILDEKGLHPLVISSKGGHYKSHIIAVDPNEIFPTGTSDDFPKSYLMILFQEVIKAEEVLRELKLIE